MELHKVIEASLPKEDMKKIDKYGKDLNFKLFQPGFKIDNIKPK